jgi:hypothetical protein
MKKIFLTLFLIVNIAAIYSQQTLEELHLRVEAFYGKKVIINKKVVSYTYTSNGKTKSDINIPMYIFINSDDKSASIRINSINLREDILLQFKCIHKKIGYDGITYTLYGDDNEIASYNIPKDGSHHGLYITLNKNDSYLFTISKYNQL